MVDFDSSHHTREEVWPGQDVPSVGHMGGWAATGQDLDLRQAERKTSLLKASEESGVLRVTSIETQPMNSLLQLLELHLPTESIKTTCGNM